MRRREGEVLQAIRSAHQFIGDHAPRFPTVAETGAYRELGAVLKRLEQHAVQQSSRDLLAQSATQAHRAARLALFRDHMLPIVAIARALAPDHPGMRVLKMPRHYLPPEILIAVHLAELEGLQPRSRRRRPLGATARRVGALLFATPLQPKARDF